MHLTVQNKNLLACVGWEVFVDNNLKFHFTFEFFPYKCNYHILGMQMQICYMYYLTDSSSCINLTWVFLCFSNWQKKCQKIDFKSILSSIVKLWSYYNICYNSGMFIQNREITINFTQRDICRLVQTAVCN